MPLSQIHHVNIVTNSGAIGRRVIISPNVEARTLAHRDLRNERHKIIGDTLRIFADEAGGMSAYRIKVAKTANTPLWVGPVQVKENLFYHQLAAAIGIGGPRGHGLDKRHHRLLTIDRGRGTEDQRLDPCATHGLKQLDTAMNIIVVIHQRLFDRLTYGLEAGKVDNGTDRVVGKHFVERTGIANVAFDKVRPLPRKTLDAFKHADFAIAEVVKNQQLMSRLREGHAGM